MRRLLAVLAAAVLAFVAGSLTAHALHAQDRPARWRFLSDTAQNTPAGGWRFEALPDSGTSAIDSVLAAQGCTRHPFAANGVDALDRVLFDSAGVRVIEPGVAAGFRRPAGAAPYYVRCPASDLLVVDSVAAARNRRGLGYARLARYDVDSLHAPVPPGAYFRVQVSTLDRSGPMPPFDVELAEDSLGLVTLDGVRAAAPIVARRLRRDAPAWYDSVTAARNAATPNWRPALGPIVRGSGVTPPAPPVPPALPSEACGSLPSLWIDQPDVRGHDVERREEVRVVTKAGACVGVVALRRTSAGDRFVVFYPPCPGAGAAWRPYATLYSTRTSAIDRAARGLACPVLRPDARPLPASRN